jgi:acetone carboxylase gamma subunit
MRLTDSLQIVDCKGKRLIGCRCGYVLCEAHRNFKEHALLIESPINKVNPLADLSGHGTQFVFREFCCPNCAVLLTTEFALKGEAILHDVELKPNS